MVDYLRLHLVPYGPLIYWGAQPLGFLEEPVTATIPHVVWNRFVTIFKRRGRRLDDEDQARTLSDNVFIPLAATLVILELADVKPGTIATGRWRPFGHRHRAAVWLGPVTRLPDASARQDVRAHAFRPLQLERA